MLLRNTLCSAESGPVQNFTVSPRANALYLSWQPPLKSNSDIDKYIVRHRRIRRGDCEPNEMSWTPIVDLLPHQTEYVIAGLEPYSYYSVKVWVRTAKHNKGQQVSVNATTIATGGCWLI